MESLARTLAKRALRGVIFQKQLPADVGAARLYVAPESRLGYLKPGLAGFDPQLLDWARKFARRGETVWDIGANVGVFSFAAAGMGARVLAVEPDPFLVSMLKRSRALPSNSHLHVGIAACAVAEREGVGQLVISASGRSSNSLEAHAALRGAAGIANDTVQVQTVQLDSLLETGGTPALIKVDVEGAELNVFQGATHTLSQIRPTWIFECGDARADAVTAIFREHGYKFYDADGDTSLEIHTTAYNTLAIPG